MIELSRDQFKTIGKNVEKMECVSRPSLTYWQDAWRRLRRNRMAYAGLIIICLYVLLAIFAPALSSYAYDAQDVKSISQTMNATHWFGTDNLGRDLFTRVWMGARVSLTIGFLATIINTLLGCVLGSLSGYYGGQFDLIFMRVVEILYGIPSLIVTLLVMAVLGPGIQSLIIAMCIVGWIGTCRFVRGEVLKLKNNDYVSAALVLGVSNRNIIFRHILPNILGLLITNLTLAIPNAIFQEAFLSYIGIGIAPPDASWGVLAKEGVRYLRNFPHQLFIPSFFICTTMLALNLLGDGLRDAFDPKLRGTE
jgi:oligopeptide transport system permease protein